MPHRTRRSRTPPKLATDGAAARRKNVPGEAAADPTFEILKVALRNQYRARAMPRPLLGTGADARYWLCLDVCGLCCAVLSQCVILFAMSSVLHDLHTHGKGFTAFMNALLCLAFGGLASLSHLKAMLCDPGAVPRAAAPLARDEERARLAASAASGYRTRAKGWCHRCASYKPPRAHHDSVTNRCIVKMDHYCPWTNNAIGVLNHKFFILFIAYTFALCMHSMVVLVQLTYASPHLPKMNRSPRRKAEYDDDVTVQEALRAFNPGKLATILVAFAAVLFGLFTACMLADQWSVLRTNVAKIDRLKGEETECASDVNEVFGGRSRGFRYDWLLPTAPVFPESVRDDIMGYRLADKRSMSGDLEFFTASFASTRLTSYTTQGRRRRGSQLRQRAAADRGRGGIPEPAHGGEAESLSKASIRVVYGPRLLEPYARPVYI